jgi:hypothetical protein
MVVAPHVSLSSRRLKEVGAKLQLVASVDPMPDPVLEVDVGPD